MCLTGAAQHRETTITESTIAVKQNKNYDDEDEESTVLPIQTIYTQAHCF